MLADSRVELEAARLLVYRAAWKADQGMDHAQDDYMAKLYATEMSERVTDRALQILGGLGYAIETPVQSFYRQVRAVADRPRHLGDPPLDDRARHAGQGGA